MILVDGLDGCGCIGGKAAQDDVQVEGLAFLVRVDEVPGGDELLSRRRRGWRGHSGRVDGDALVAELVEQREGVDSWAC